ncbi:histidine phosphatase family protein [soil metagenome]
MATQLVFETHSTTEDNEAGLATGWLPGRLSALGRKQALELGERRHDDGLAAVFCSDLRRAVQTAEIAFAGSDLPVLHDWRLRECDYGEANGMPAGQLDKRAHLDRPYPGGESWRQAVHRVGAFLDDVPRWWNGRRVLVLGHVATRWGLDHFLDGVALEELVDSDFAWREGWHYRIDQPDTEAIG